MTEKLKLNKEFRRLYGRGKSFVHRGFVAYILPERSGKIRYGITAGKKLGGAVTRNRVKRILREGLREVMRSRELRGGFLIVIAARERVRDKKSTDVARELSSAFHQLGLFARRPDAK